MPTFQPTSKPLMCPDCGVDGYWYYDSRCERCFKAHKQLKQDEEVAVSVLNALQKIPALRESLMQILAQGPTCKVLIPGTFIVCGENGNYCSAECHATAKR